MTPKTLLLTGAVCVALAACSDKPKGSISTLETVNAKSAVEAYDASATQNRKLLVEKALAELDLEIKELEVRVDATTGDKHAEAADKLALLKKRASEIRSDYNEANFHALIQDIKDSVR